MKSKWIILPLLLALATHTIVKAQQQNPPNLKFEFLGGIIEAPYDKTGFVDFTAPLSQESIQEFYEKLSSTAYQPIVQELKTFKTKYNLDDWLYYQLIRRTAQQLSPKAENYHRYTLYKWFLLARSGYDAILTIANDRILFYVQCDENIYNIPSRLRNGRQYVCLNYHDYGSIDFEKNTFTEINITVPDVVKGFSYKISHLPEFKPGDYKEKLLQFTYYKHLYQFSIKLNPEVKTLFTNYPVVDYESYFNIPLSRETYSSLIPALKKNISGMSVKNGVEYLMRFTRDAFGFIPDSENFGNEKRLSPEQTLLYGQSDCEDRAALFFFLVREIYDLPMIVLAFPQHVTIAVKFDKPVGKPIVYNGEAYSVCEPTPQDQDLKLGQLLPVLRKSTYEVAYVYTPQHK